MGLRQSGQIDHINQMKTLTVVANCNLLCYHFFQFQDMSSSESNGHEPFELTAADMTPQKNEPSPQKNEMSHIEMSLAPKTLFGRKKSQDESPVAIQRHFAGDTPFQETHKAALKMVTPVSPPKTRPIVAQV